MSKIDIDKAMQLTTKEFISTIQIVYRIANAKIDKLIPTHGNCCMCQRCGHDHDECKCIDNDFIEACDRLDAQQKEIEGLKIENKQLRGKEPIPGSWWSECPRLAQKVLERTMEENDRLTAENKTLKGEKP